MSCFVCENIKYLLEQRKINPDVLAKKANVAQLHEYTHLQWDVFENNKSQV